MGSNGVGSFDQALVEVGFPGVKEEIQETSPTTQELTKKEETAFFARTEFEYKTFVKVFNCLDTKESEELAELTSKFMNTKPPRKVGEAPGYMRLKEESTFTKDGSYLVAVRWAECRRIKVEAEVSDKEEKNDKPAEPTSI